MELHILLRLPFYLLLAFCRNEMTERKRPYVLQSNKSVSEQSWFNEGACHCRDQHDQHDKIKRRSYRLDILL